MSAEQHETSIPRVPESLAKAELGRLLSDPRFRVTERQRSIINYLADLRFSGLDESAKAYAIALDVLGKSASFDPSADPIVRIEMSRLRSTLEDHYQAFGHETETWISIPRGRYLTEFSFHPPSLSTVPLEALDEPPKLEDDHDATASAVSPNWKKPAVAAVACALVGIVALAVGLHGRPVVTDKPTVRIDFAATDPRLAGEASLTRDMLLAALTQFRTLTLVVGDSTPSSEAMYRVEIKYYATDGDRRSRWQVIDNRSGHLVDAGVETIEGNGRNPVAVRADSAAALATRLGSSRGAISLNELKKGPREALGNVCVLRAQLSAETGDQEGVANATTCLKATIAAQPTNADALGSQAQLLLLGRDPASIDSALILANKAVASDPLSDRAHLAMARVQFAGGSLNAAIASSNRAMELNPNDPDVAGTLATLLFAGGFWQAADDMANDAHRFPELAPRNAMLIKALNSYRSADWATAASLAEQITPPDPISAMLTTAALGQLGSADAKQKFAELLKRDQDFERTFHARMAWQRYKPDVARSIEEGLRRAGANFERDPIASANSF